MNAGDYNQRITLQARQAGQDGLGQPVVGFTDVATVWANIRQYNGAEAIKAGANASSIQASIRIRWRTGLTADMRLRHGSNTYLIQAVLPDMAERAHIDLVCQLVQ